MTNLDLAPLSLASPCHRRARGFTLVELIVAIVIVAILAAIVTPRFIALGTDARVAAVTTLASALRTQAEDVHAMCKLDPGCDYNTQFQSVTIGGRDALVTYGWLDGGNTGANFVEGWVNYSGFTVSYPDALSTKFAFDGAPTPGGCSATFSGTYYGGPSAIPVITVVTSGC